MVPREIRDVRVAAVLVALLLASTLLPWLTSAPPPPPGDEHVHSHGEGGEDDIEWFDGDEDHHHVPPEEDEFGPGDWIAEVTDKAGNVREVRAVLKREGIHYLTPFNLRSAIVHSVGEMGQRLVVLLYKPESELCVELAPHWRKLGSLVERVVNASQNGTSPVTLPVMLGAFRVNAFADQDEVDSRALTGSGGDGAEVIRENHGPELLDDVPAVVMFKPDTRSKTGITMVKWNGSVSAKTILHDIAHDAGLHGEATAAIENLISDEEDRESHLGDFSDGVLDFHAEE